MTDDTQGTPAVVPAALGAPAASSVASPIDPVAQARAERAGLIRDPAFSRAAMNPRSPEWARLQALDSSIASGLDAREAADERFREENPGAILKAPPDDGPARRPSEQLSDEERVAAEAEEAKVFSGAPERPGQYRFATDRARELGLPIDDAKEIALRIALHQADVPQALAGTIYSAAIGAAAKPPTAVEQEGEYRRNSHELRREWGAAFESNLATANAEARRIFDAMPPSITHGLSFGDWCRASGIANSRPVILQLLARARARDRRA